MSNDHTRGNISIGGKRRRSSHDLAEIISLSSGNPIKRRRVIQLGRPDDYDTNLNEEGEPITRGDESRLMDPPVSIVDDLYWIRSDDRSDPDVLDLVGQLNDRYTEHVSDSDFQRVQNELFEDMKSRVAGNNECFPHRFFSTNFEDYTKMVEGKGHPIYCRRNIDTGENRILLDVNEFVKSVENPDACDVTNVTTSFDCRYMTYAVDLTGDEKYELHVWDLITSEKVRHSIPSLIYGFYLWTPDSRGIFYYGYDQAERVHQVWHYSFETGVSTMLYQEDDTLFQVDVSLSTSLNYVFIGTTSMDTTEFHFCSTSDNIADPNSYRLIRPRVTHVKYFPDTVDRQRVTVVMNGADIQNYPEFLVIRTNADDAHNFKLVWADISNPSEWTDLVPHLSTRFIESVDTVSNYILVDYRENGYARAGYVHLGSGIENAQLDPIDIDGALVGLEKGQSVNSIPSTIQFSDSHNQNYRSRSVYVSYESMVHPQKLIRVRLPMDRISALKSKVVWEKATPNYDPTLYDTRIIQVPSSDGVETIPVSILYRTAVFSPQDPVPVPLYLYGYGAYGINMDTSFISRIFSLIDRGYIFAIAHVRGSSSKGYNWYLDGKMHNKQNTFTDFIDCAKYLIANNYTRPNLLSVEGRSAGGLLMGGILTQAPELFNTVIMGVPFVDVLVTMSDSTIPLTTDEWVEWGNPNYAEDYEVMAKYSPIDNLRHTEYPNTYITCGLNDPRVQYWEPVKFHLRLLENCLDDNHHIIRVDTDKGHFTNTDRYARLEEFAKQYAFVVCNTTEALE